MRLTRPKPIFAVLCAVVALAGCMGSDDTDEPAEGAQPERVDSALEFRGERREVARVIEAFEAAVLAGDSKTICGELLAVDENRGYDDDNGGQEFCAIDPASRPEDVLNERGVGAFDLVVTSVEREGKKPALRRFEARVRVGESRQEFVVERFEGDWAITARDLDAGAELTSRPEDRECESEGLTVRSSLAPRVNDPGEAVKQGPFGDRIETALEKGGSFELDHVSYRPDYVVSYVLRNNDGEFIAGFPVRVWRPRSYDVYSMTFCRKDGLSMVII